MSNENSQIIKKNNERKGLYPHNQKILVKNVEFIPKRNGSD